ncbi:glycosyltransferase family 4 protein [Candidatus Saccharibacteria bacterium]|nr:glycosyltransferase family 4 protein [Candidatus Saccharibacteria bacterium]
MKIGFVLDDSLDKSDGVQQYVLTLGQWFQAQGNQVHYLVGQTARTDIANVHSLSRNIQARFNQNRMSTPLPASKLAIKKLLAAEDFDVLHVQLPYSPLLAARVIRGATPKTLVVGTFHIVPYSKFESAAAYTLGLVLKRSLKRFDAIYSVSEPARIFANHGFGISSTVVPNVVNLAKYKNAKPFKRYDDDTVTIVFLGRLVERKGCMLLLEALEKLHKKNKLERVRVLICGKGPLQATLEAYVRAKHLGHIVHFTGYLDETSKAKYLSSADIAIFPSTGGESFGIVLIEAMAAGARVVIGGDNIGYRSVLGQKPEQLVSPSDTGALAKTLHHYISSNRARMQAYKWQQEHIRNFDVRVVGNHLLQEYESMIAKRHNNTDNKE